MIVYPRELILKDATPIILRPAEREDLEGLFNFFSRIPKSDLLIYKDDVTKWETVESWFTNPKYNKILQLIALKNDDIIAKGTLHQEGLYWHHAVEIKLVVEPEYRSRGLGSTMFKILLAEGLLRKFEKIIVRFTPDNRNFMRILEHYGFKPEAALRCYIDDEEGKGLKDLIIASYSIEDWEGRFEFYDTVYGKGTTQRNL
jgi:RimJ/RimL family protein N-acetyltransferase